MDVMFCSMLPKVRNHGFVNAYMLGKLIIQNALFVNNCRTFANLSELLRALLSQPDVNIVCTLETCLVSPAYSLTNRIVRKALSFSTVTVNTW